MLFDEIPVELLVTDIVFKNYILHDSFKRFVMSS